MLSTWVFFAAVQFGTSLIRHNNMMKDVVFFAIYGSALLFMLILLAPLLRKLGVSPKEST
jgi:hypothetical protein